MSLRFSMERQKTMCQYSQEQLHSTWEAEAKRPRIQVFLGYPVSLRPTWNSETQSQQNKILSYSVLKGKFLRLI